MEACLGATRDRRLASRALKGIVRQCFEEGKFYEAEFQVNRTERLQLELEQFESWRLLVEGVNDLIKRKHTGACSKLERAVEAEGGQQSVGQQAGGQGESGEAREFLRHAYLYLGYAYFSCGRLPQSAEAYRRALLYHGPSDYLLASKLIAEGTHLHALRQFAEANAKFAEAFELEERLETLFVLCIGKVAELRAEEGLRPTAGALLEKYF